MLRRSCFILVLLCCTAFCFGDNGYGYGYGNGGNGNGNNGNGNGNGNGNSGSGTGGSATTGNTTSTSKNNTPPGTGNNHGNPANLIPSVRPSRSADGAYTVVIIGAFSGQGQATVTDTTVSIQGTVKDAAGNTSTLTTTTLAINGPYFSGQGTALGQSVTIVGRLDAAAASRLVCTIIAQDGRSARAIGTLPPDVDPPQAGWVDPNNLND